MHMDAADVLSFVSHAYKRTSSEAGACSGRLQFPSFIVLMEIKLIVFSSFLKEDELGRSVAMHLEGSRACIYMITWQHYLSNDFVDLYH